MVKIRIAEETIADMVTAGHVKCPVHLAIGQEAVSVGIAANLRASDRAFGNHRSHGHYVAMGGDMRKLFAEVLGKYTGCSHGFGGSMHLFAQEVGFFGSVPIVAGTIPLAVGAGIAAKFDGKGDVAVAFFGDGACEEGVFHECLNMTAIMKLPVIFVVENNLFSSHLDINLRQPSDRIGRFAEAACISHKTVDGNDVTSVMKEAGELIAKARAQNSPALIEAITYRWRGHVGPREDIDVGLRRSQEDIDAWKMRDPVERLLKSLIAGGHYSREEFDEFAAKTRADFVQLKDEVYNDPWPAENTLMDYVYASK
jgi:pyruvate dehydrogenase E1 component alpha subunit